MGVTFKQLPHSALIQRFIYIHIGHTFAAYSYSSHFYWCSVRTDLLASGAQSRLHIAGATFTDSGNYTCMMGRTAKTQIELQIIPGALLLMLSIGR